jgi:hypothetical protein
MPPTYRSAAIPVTVCRDVGAARTMNRLASRSRSPGATRNSSAGWRHTVSERRRAVARTRQLEHQAGVDYQDADDPDEFTRAVYPGEQWAPLPEPPSR